MKYQVDEISKKIQKEKNIKKVIKIIITIILLLLFCFNGIMLWQKMKNNEEISNVFGISYLNIISGSMEPSININDLIIIKKVSEEEIKVGDIITFKNTDESIQTHRIVDIIEDKKIKRYKTKGDNNNIEDEELIQYNDIYGKYLFKIPKIGNTVNALQESNGLSYVLILLIIFIILKNKKDKTKEKRKLEREKYELKRERDEYNK